MNVLVVEDDHDLLAMLDFALKRAGFGVLQTSDGPTALRHVREQHPDLVVLDVNLGRWNGFDLLKEIRQDSQVPVIMLTARGAEDDKIKGLELGADDYMTKPFSYRELIARIQMHVERHGARGRAGGVAAAGGPLRVGPLELNPTEHTITKDGRALDLTPTEFKVLQCLAERVGTVVPTRALLKEVWGYDDPSGGDLVRVTLYRLRRKIEDDPSAPQLIHTTPGVGVMIKAP
jgi:DNA-binding response OmpR family regulator